MKNQDFTATVWVEQTSAEAYNTILHVREWWSGLYGESFEGSSEEPGDEFSFLAGGGVHYTKQKLVELVPNKKVVWLVTEANLSFVDKTDEWNENNHHVRIPLTIKIASHPNGLTITV